LYGDPEIFLQAYRKRPLYLYHISDLNHFHSRPGKGYCSICYWGTVFEISSGNGYVGGVSEYDELCGINIVNDPLNIANPIIYAGQQDFVAIPGKSLQKTYYIHSQIWP